MRSKKIMSIMTMILQGIKMGVVVLGTVPIPNRLVLHEEFLWAVQTGRVKL